MKQIVKFLSLLVFVWILTANVALALTFPVDFRDCLHQDKAIVLSGWYNQPRIYGYHKAYDIPAERGKMVKSPELGEITVVGQEYAKYDPKYKQWKSGYGNYIDIGIYERRLTVIGEVKVLKYSYRVAHLERVFVREGDTVYEGQKIGEVGATGIVDERGRPQLAYHLHFERRSPEGYKINCLREFTPLVQDYFQTKDTLVFAVVGSGSQNN